MRDSLRIARDRITESHIRMKDVEALLQFIWGITNDIQGYVTSSTPTKIREAIRMAHDLMDQVMWSKAAKNGENKRKLEDNHKTNT
nr:hypothetical protein [Tanacetum cinerariifolium]